MVPDPVRYRSAMRFKTHAQMPRCNNQMVLDTVRPATDRHTIHNTNNHTPCTRTAWSDQCYWQWHIAHWLVTVGVQDMFLCLFLCLVDYSEVDHQPQARLAQPLQCSKAQIIPQEFGGGAAWKYLQGLNAQNTAVALPPSGIALGTKSAHTPEGVNYKIYCQLPG